MTTILEPGSREWTLQNPGSKTSSWIAADGPADMADHEVARLSAFHATFGGGPTPRYWLDYSGARPDLNVARNTGAIGVSRYIAPPIASCDWKRITPAERDHILAAKLDLWLNWEWYAGRCLEGAGAGAEDGRWAAQALNALAYPHGRTMPASHDTGAQNDAAVGAYLNAFNAQLQGNWKLVTYGSFHQVKTFTRVPAGCNWQTAAWSGGQQAPDAAAIFQNANQWFNGTVDENIVWRYPFGAWNSPLVVPVPPKPPAPGPLPFPFTPGKVLNMIMVQTDPKLWPVGQWPGVFMLADNTLKHIAHGADVLAYRSAGVPGVLVITVDEFKGYPIVGTK